MHSISYHEPVLLKEAVEHLVTDESGIYIDGTLGGGGHSAEILKSLNNSGKVYGIDQDDDALATASERINDERFLTVKGNFGYMDVLMPISSRGKVAGILLDLGVSSYQINEGARGFSFREDGPLDMRMDTNSGKSAYDVLNNYSESDLVNILFTYGEERFSRKIANAIINRRPMATTNDLKTAVEAAVKGPHVVKSLARVFQAIRIEVNQELEMLKMALEKCVTMLRPGGRLVAISYHSLEDRLVKHFIRSGNFDGHVQKDFYGNCMRPLEPFKPALITPSDIEITKNPRARSAKMRIGVKSEMKS
jgi:16S rRNA (cytosine1402-N4)-methyltransferase